MKILFAAEFTFHTRDIIDEQETARMFENVLGACDSQIFIAAKTADFHDRPLSNRFLNLGEVGMYTVMIVR